MVSFGRSNTDGGSRRKRSRSHSRVNLNPFARSRPPSLIGSIQSTAEVDTTCCRSYPVEMRSGVKAAKVTGSVDGLFSTTTKAPGVEASMCSAKASLVLGVEDEEVAPSPQDRPRRWPFPRRSLKRNSSKLSLTPSIQTPEEQKMPSSEPPSRRGSNDKLREYLTKQQQQQQQRCARDSPSISQPSNFQHLIHTQPHQYTNMSSTNKDLVAEFSAHRAGQPAQKQLRGIKVENISSRSSMETAPSPLTSESSKDSLQSSTPTSPGSTTGQTFRVLRTKGSFSQPFKAPPTFQPQPGESERHETPQANPEDGPGLSSEGRSQLSCARLISVTPPDPRVQGVAQPTAVVARLPPVAAVPYAPLTSSSRSVANATDASPTPAAAGTDPGLAAHCTHATAQARAPAGVDNIITIHTNQSQHDGRGRPANMTSHHGLETILPSVSEESGLANFSDCHRMLDLPPNHQMIDTSHQHRGETFLSSPSPDSPEPSRSATPPPLAPPPLAPPPVSFKKSLKPKQSLKSQSTSGKRTLAPPGCADEFRVSMNRSSMAGGLFSSWAADTDSSDDEGFESNIPAQERAIPIVTEEAEEEGTDHAESNSNENLFNSGLVEALKPEPSETAPDLLEPPSPSRPDASMPQLHEVIPRRLIEPDTSIPERKPRLDSAIGLEDHDLLPEEPPPVPSKLYIPSSFPSLSHDRPESPRSALRHPQNSGRLRRGSKNSGKSVRFQEQDLASENRSRRRSPNKPDYSEIRANLENLQRSLSKLELQAAKPPSYAEPSPKVPPPPPSAPLHAPGFGHKRRKTAEGPDAPTSFGSSVEPSSSGTIPVVLSPRTRARSVSPHSAVRHSSILEHELPPPIPPKPASRCMPMI